MRGWGVRVGVHGVVLSGHDWTVGAVHGGCCGVGGGGGRVVLGEGRRVDGIVVIHHVWHARIWL